MRNETPFSELIRLRKEQTKAREDEVFVGLSPAERSQYDQRTKRINELATELRMTAISEKSSERSAEEEQKSRWNQRSETDTPQSEAHQPYRSREENSSIDNDRNLSNSHKRKGKNGPEEKGDE
jgi:protein subunit release factor B